MTKSTLADSVLHRNGKKMLKMMNVKHEYNWKHRDDRCDGCWEDRDCLVGYGSMFAISCVVPNYLMSPFDPVATPLPFSKFGCWIV